MGTPTPQEWPGMTELKEFHNFTAHLPKYPKRTLQQVCPSLAPTGLDILDKMLQFDPANRWTAKDLLKHEYLADLKKDPNSVIHKSEVDFDKKPALFIRKGSKKEKDENKN